MSSPELTPMEPHPEYAETDPRYHAERIIGMLDELIRHVREDITRVREPKAQALFETTAEVLTGLRTAYEHYRQGAEPAMREAA